MLPLEMLSKVSRTFLDAWKQASEMRKDRGTDGLPTWPDWCYLPIAGWMSIVLHGMGKNRPDLDDVYPSQLLAALGPWRYTQGIYRFHPILYDALRGTVPQGDMPVEVLYRLPEWSLYLETPGLDWAGQAMAGFFAHLEHDVNTGRNELRLLIVPSDEDAPCTAVPLHIGAWTITEALDRAFGSISRKTGLADESDAATHLEDIAASAYPLVSLLLYLCSDEPDLIDPAAPGERPSRPRPKKVKRGWELFPAQKPRIWQLGEAIGPALEAAGAARGASAPAERKGPAPHVRRAHWHGYWTGARTEEGQRERPRSYRYQWLPPIIVGVDND